MVTVTVARSDGRTHVLRPPSRAATWAWLSVWAVSGISGWGSYWLVWLFGGLVAPELYTLAAHVPHGSLSATVWGFEGLNRAHPFDFGAWSPAHWVIAVLLWVTLAWLSVHLPFGLLS